MALVIWINRVWRWLPALAIMSLIFYLSSQPADALPSFGPLDVLLKKAGHLIIYGLLGLAYVFALGHEQGFKRSHLVAMLLIMLFAVSDEYHQSFVPGRNAWWGDVLIDGSGAALAIFLFTRYSNSNSNSTS